MCLPSHKSAIRQLIMASAIPDAFGQRGLIFAAGYVGIQVGRTNDHGRDVGGLHRKAKYCATAEPVTRRGLSGRREVSGPLSRNVITVKPPRPEGQPAIFTDRFRRL